MNILRYALLSVFFCCISILCLAQKDKLVGRWVFVVETYNENMVRAYGPLAEMTNLDSLRAHIIKEKKMLMGSYDMVFSKNDQCESQGVKFKYQAEGDQLKLNWINYVIKHLDDKELLICEGAGGTCNKFYKESYYKSLTKEQVDQTLAINRYDSLLINCIVGRQQLSHRKDLFNVSAFPKYSSGVEKVDEVLAKNLGSLYAGLGDNEKGFDLKLSFVLEPNGSASCAGVEIMETKRYECFLNSMNELGNKWVPFGKDGKPIASLVSLPIKINQ